MCACRQKEVAMIVVLWVLNILLAVAFAAVGAMKLLRPRDALAASSGMGWAGDFAPGTVKLIGAIEVVGALGLILPLATGIAAILTPLAAVGLVVVMIGATVVHVRRREAPMPAAALGVLAAVSAVIGFIVVG